MNAKLILILVSLVVLSEAYIVKPFLKDVSIGDFNELEQKPSALYAKHDETLFIPMRSHSSQPVGCVDGICELGCKILGWSHGRCVGPNTCQCYS